MRAAPAVACLLCACAAPLAPISTADLSAAVEPSSGAGPSQVHLDRRYVAERVPEALDLQTESELPAEVIAARLAPVSSSRAEEERGSGRDGFTYWDDDGDGTLSADELTESLIEAWDRNRDGAIDRAEWPG